MIAPHAPGLTVRETFRKKQKLSAFIAVHRDYTGNASEVARDLAVGIGFDKNRLVETTFEQEALGDLFGEQAVLCGGLAMLVKSGFDTLVEHGLPAENAYLEVAYQLDLIVDLIKNFGIEGMLKRISVAARVGAVQAGPEVIDGSVRRRVNEIYERVQSGAFAKQLADLSPRDLKRLNNRLKHMSTPAFEKQARKYSGAD